MPRKRHHTFILTYEQHPRRSHRSIAGRFQQDSSLGRATRAKEAQYHRAAHLADLDERDRRQRQQHQQRGDRNASSCPGLTLTVTIQDVERRTHGRSRPPATTSASLVVPPTSISRSSLRLSRPISGLKRPPSATTTAATESMRKPASPRKENRQTATERAVRVYSHIPGVASSGSCRPWSPRGAGSTSPRGSRPPWKEMRGPAAERRQSTHAKKQRHPLPWPLQDGSFERQVRVSCLYMLRSATRHAKTCFTHFQSRSIPSRPRAGLLRFWSLVSSPLRRMRTRYLP